MISNNALNKEYITEIKQAGGDALLSLLKQRKANVGDIIFILENLGYLSTSFDPKPFIYLLDHENENIRFWAIKNIGKLKLETLIPLLSQIANKDKSTIVKREAVASMGRIRASETIPFLTTMLSNDDPKIICQAIRALLVFKNNESVDNSLKELINHENEMVRTVIYKEYFAKEKTKKSTLLHADTYPYLKNVIVNADVLEVLKFVPEESIHLTFTSPPYYNARDYSIYASYEAYLKFLEEVFLETFRITKEGRFLIVNTSPVIVPRISRAHSSKRYSIPFVLHYILSKMGWELIDDIIWMKLEYSVNISIGGFQQQIGRAHD